jgi:hypothetical protein
MDTRTLAAATAALGLAAGLGLGYLLFHSSGTTGATSTQKAATTSAPVSPGTFDLTGSITLKHGDYVGDSSGACAGSSGYDDVTGGAGVTITDQAGTVIATGTLDAGNTQSAGCKLAFTVTVPASKPFYGVQVSHRGVVQFSGDQAKSGGVALSLGGS